VLAKCVGNVPEPPPLEILEAAPRIDEPAAPVAGHSVDRKVAPFEVLLDGDRRRRVERESGVARRDLALGPCERVLLAGLGVQEDGEILADLLEAERGQLLRPGPDDEPVPLADRPAEQAVPDRSADFINFHSSRSYRTLRRGIVARHAMAETGRADCARLDAAKLRDALLLAGDRRAVRAAAQAHAARGSAGGSEPRRAGQGNTRKGARHSPVRVRRAAPAAQRKLYDVCR